MNSFNFSNKNLTEQNINYDLSKTEKYSLEIDSKTNEITIIEKTTNTVIQKISADMLSRCLNILPYAQGVNLNKNL